MPANYGPGRIGGIANVMTLRSRFDSTNKDLITAFQLAVQRKPATAAGWSSWKFLPPDDKVVIEGVFLRLVSAWDSFIENTFCYYLAGGGQSLSVPPTLRNAQHSTAGVAAQYVLTTYRSRPTISFLAWSHLSAVTRRSTAEFSSNDPYKNLDTFLAANHSHNLIRKAARSARNFIAHETDSARAAFKSDVSPLIGSRITDSSRPYMALLEQVADPVTGTSVRLFEAASSVYKCMARIVVP